MRYDGAIQEPRSSAHRVEYFMITVSRGAKQPTSEPKKRLMTSRSILVRFAVLSGFLLMYLTFPCGQARADSPAAMPKPSAETEGEIRVCPRSPARGGESRVRHPR